MRTRGADAASVGWNAGNVQSARRSCGAGRETPGHPSSMSGGSEARASLDHAVIRLVRRGVQVR